MGVFDLLRPANPQTLPKSVSLDLDGAVVEVTLRLNNRARRISLKMDPAKGPVLVIPKASALPQAMAFLQAQTGWLQARLAKRIRPIQLQPGATIWFKGQQVMLCHAPEARRGTWVQDGEIHVSGPLESFERRMRDFLKSQARQDIVVLAQPMAASLGKKITRISVKDTTSRWGSCSSDGALSFSWRLIFAPPEILRYVVAHEVAHLVEMNHQPEFWAVVAKLDPFYEVHRAWLKNQGSALHQMLPIC